MNTRRQRPPTTSARSTSTSGSLSARRLSMSVCSVVIDLTPYAKKAGGRPLSVLLPAPARRHESCRSRIAAAPSAHSAAQARCGVAARTFAVQPVVGALGGQRAGQRERLAGLAVASRAAASSGPGRTARSRWWACCEATASELRGGAFVALGVKQRAPERLADRGLVGLEVARLAQRHDRGLVVAVVEQLAAPLVEVVDALHRTQFNRLLAQAPDGVEDRVGDLRLGGARHVALGDPPAPFASPWRVEDRDLVGVDVEADVRARDVVDDDRVEPLGGELAARVLDRAARRARRRSRPASGPSRRLRGEPGEHVGGRLEHELQALALGLLDLAVGGRRGREVGDGGGHQQHVAARGTPLARVARARRR